MAEAAGTGAARTAHPLTGAIESDPDPEGNVTSTLAAAPVVWAMTTSVGLPSLVPSTSAVTQVSGLAAVVEPEVAELEPAAPEPEPVEPEVVEPAPVAGRGPTMDPEP